MHGSLEDERFQRLSDLETNLYRPSPRWKKCPFADSVSSTSGNKKKGSEIKFPIKIKRYATRKMSKTGLIVLFENEGAKVG